MSYGSADYYSPSLRVGLVTTPRRTTAAAAPTAAAKPAGLPEDGFGKGVRRRTIPTTAAAADNAGAPSSPLAPTAPSSPTRRQAGGGGLAFAPAAARGARSGHASVSSPPPSTAAFGSATNNAAAAAGGGSPPLLASTGANQIATHPFGGNSVSPSAAQQQHHHHADPNRYNLSAAPSSPARAQRGVLEAAHEAELHRRAEVHQKLLAATAGRKARAQAILDLHRSEMAQLEAAIRQCEAETSALEAARRELSDGLRRAEVVAYRTTKDAKVLKLEAHAARAAEQRLAQQRRLAGTPAAAAAGIAGPVGLLSAAAIAASPWTQAAVGAAGGLGVSATSPLRLLYGGGTPALPVTGATVGTAASILAAPTDAFAASLYPHIGPSAAVFGSSSFSVGGADAAEAQAAAALDFLSQRLAEARRVGDALESECAADEAALAAQKKERAALKDLIAVAESHVKDLEGTAAQTAADLRAAQEKMRAATEGAEALPSLRRLVEDNAVTLALQKASSAATTRALMDAIKADDEKLAQLRRAHGGSGESALHLQLASALVGKAASPVKGLSSSSVLAAAQRTAGEAGLGPFGAAFAGSLIGKIATDLEAENAFYAASAAEVVGRAETERTKLQSAADALASRARILEEKLVRARS